MPSDIICLLTACRIVCGGTISSASPAGEWNRLLSHGRLVDKLCRPADLPREARAFRTGQGEPAFHARLAAMDDVAARRPTRRHHRAGRNTAALQMHAVGGQGRAPCIVGSTITASTFNFYGTPDAASSVPGAQPPPPAGMPAAAFPPQLPPPSGWAPTAALAAPRSGSSTDSAGPSPAVASAPWRTEPGRSRPRAAPRSLRSPSCPPPSRRAPVRLVSRSEVRRQQQCGPQLRFRCFPMPRSPLAHHARVPLDHLSGALAP
jgi:hypothetical protein